MPDRDKSTLMRSVNEGIAFFASDLEPSDPGAPDRWLFVCECGGAECVEWVDLESVIQLGEILAEAALDYCA